MPGRYYEPLYFSSDATEGIIKVAGTRFKDSGGGFLIEESAIAQDKKPAENEGPVKIVHTQATHPILNHKCQDCGEDFIDSYLQTNFSFMVCDNCR